MQDGRCKTLDAGADGYMRGEACVVHLIEAFEAAELAACHLSNGALILHGTAVNQDGRSSSLTVQTMLSSGKPRLYSCRWRASWTWIDFDESTACNRFCCQGIKHL